MVSSSEGSICTHGSGISHCYDLEHRLRSGVSANKDFAVSKTRSLEIRCVMFLPIMISL